MDFIAPTFKLGKKSKEVGFSQISINNMAKALNVFTNPNLKVGAMKNTNSLYPMQLSKNSAD